MEDLDRIKKNYGEKMSHLCRELFPSILEKDGLLPKILDNTFNHSFYLYEDIVNSDSEFLFKDYIYGQLKEKKEVEDTDKTPKELLKSVGYNLYECKSEEDIQKFKKYYRHEESLCTFNGGRLNKHYVFFAIKEDIDNIKREMYKEPKREDSYGRSAISIQFTKGMHNTLSIKNRYNHTVKKPDSTYYNHLDNIVKGLTKSFEKEYFLNILDEGETNFELDNYVKANDSKYYKYNYEENNIYYCTDNIIIDNFEVKKYPKEKYIVFDKYILDKENKTIKTYDKSYDGFVDNLNNIESIKEIKIDKNTKKVIINENIELTIDKYNQLISYKDNNIKIVRDNFLKGSRNIKEIELNNALVIQNNFLENANSLEKVLIKNVKSIGNNFAKNDEELSELDLPNVLRIKDNFMYSNKNMESIFYNKVKSIGNNFFYNNSSIRHYSFNNLLVIGDNFIPEMYHCNDVNLPKVKRIGNNFMREKLFLSNIYLPDVEEVGDNFLYKSFRLDSANLKKLKRTGKNFLWNNFYATELIVENLEEVGDDFMYQNTKMENFYAPKLIKKGNNFFHERIKEKDIKVLIKK
ncbi:MAG: hypothetical protein IKH54_06095 [Bacilli bacterium]|nr:hypothetical protein [Bacilli bacterium]